MNLMRSSSATILSKAAHTCKWDNEQQLTVLCSHIVTLVPDGDFDRMFDATQLWITDSGLPYKLVIISLTLLIDEQEAAPDFKGDRFDVYVKSLLEASGATTTADKEAKSEKAKTGKGRGRKKAAPKPEPEVEKKAPKGTAEAPARSKPKEQKFPAGTVSAPIPACSTPAPVPVVSDSPPKVMLCGYLEQPFCDITKELLALEAPVKDQRLGALMAKQTIPLPGGLEMHLELINGRPSPGVDVYISKDGKSVSQLVLPIREYTERYELSYNGTNYKVLPPGG